MSSFPIFTKYFESTQLATDTKPQNLQKVFKYWADKYHGGLPSLPELDWLVRNDDRKLVTTTEMSTIEAAYKSACVTAFGYWLSVGATGLYFSRNLWQHWPTPARVAVVTGSVFVPFYYYPIARTDRGLLRELSTHDTWLGREVRQRTKPGFFAEEEKLEAAKEAKKSKADPAVLGYKSVAKPEAAKKDANKQEHASAHGSH